MLLKSKVSLAAFLLPEERQRLRSVLAAEPHCITCTNSVKLAQRLEARGCDPARYTSPSIRPKRVKASDFDGQQALVTLQSFGRRRVLVYISMSICLLPGSLLIMLRNNSCRARVS